MATPTEGTERKALYRSDWTHIQKEAVGRYTTYAVFVVLDETGNEEPQYVLCEVAGGILGNQEFGLPGGGMEPGENPIETLTREVPEEISTRVLDQLLVSTQDTDAKVIPIHKGPMRNFRDRLRGITVMRGGQETITQQTSIVFAVYVNANSFNPKEDGKEVSNIRLVTLKEARQMQRNGLIVQEVLDMIEKAANPEAATIDLDSIDDSLSEITLTIPSMKPYSTPASPCISAFAHVAAQNLKRLS